MALHYFCVVTAGRCSRVKSSKENRILQAVFHDFFSHLFSHQTSLNLEIAYPTCLFLGLDLYHRMAPPPERAGAKVSPSVGVGVLVLI